MSHFKSTRLRGNRIEEVDKSACQSRLTRSRSSGAKPLLTCADGTTSLTVPPEPRKMMAAVDRPKPNPTLVTDGISLIAK